MTKAVTYLILFASIAVLTVGLSPSLQRSIVSLGWVPDQYQYGDLYNISNLRAFKERDYLTLDAVPDSCKPKQKFSNIHLYTIGDSFTPMDTSFYAGGRNEHIWMGNGTLPLRLDSTKTNLLVIEIIERTIQERLNSWTYQKMYIDMGFIPEAKAKPVEAEMKQDEPSWLFARFGSEINQRLEFLLFNFRPFLLLKELKAQLMLDLMDRTHENALISRDRQHLFYMLEAAPKSPLSSFLPIADSSITAVVHNINDLRSYYRAQGFDEVYFCFIPNKVTVLEPNRGPYNNQIKRIEQHPDLNAPVLSVIDTIRKHPEWYHKGDGHWLWLGKRYYLQRVNALAAEWAAGKAPQQTSATTPDRQGPAMP